MSKMMRKLCCLCLAASLVLGLAACGSKKEKAPEPKKNTTDDADKTKKKEEPEEKPEPYAKGTVAGNHFESAWLNMQADFSETYVMASEDEISQMQSTGSQLMMDEEGKENADAVQREGIMTNEMMAVAVEGIPNCTLAVEKLALQNMTAKQYLQATRDALIQSITDDYKIAAKGAMPTVTIAGEEYMCLQATMHIEDLKLNSNTYVRIKDGYAVVLNVTFDESTEKQKEELLAAFKPMK